MAWNEPGGNDNDPWGNRKKDAGGPPDLDEVFKNLKNWFDSLAGNKGGGANRSGASGGGTGLPGGNIGGKGVALIAGVVGLIWLASGIYVIQPAQAGVVTQFGAYVKTTTPGPHWRLPFPLQNVEKVDVEEIRSAKLVNQLILTQDELEFRYAEGKFRSEIVNREGGLLLIEPSGVVAKAPAILQPPKTDETLVSAPSALPKDGQAVGTSGSRSA